MEKEENEKTSSQEKEDENESSLSVRLMDVETRDSSIFLEAYLDLYCSCCIF